MIGLTAVALKEKDDDHNNSPDTGIFVTHSPTKSYSKKTYMFLNNYSSILLGICLVLFGLLQQCISTSDIATRNVEVFKSPPAPYECGSMDIRTDCENLAKLKNCTAITGFLDIVYLPRPDFTCNFSDYKFENLREITDFLIMHDLRNLTSIKNMFPNLSVIRGRRLFVNYALVMTSLHDLEKIEFKSLIALQRGNVIIDSNPKLCFTEKINWARLTLSRGRNNIFLDEKIQCPEEATCNGCKRDSCWSNDVCQKIESDSVLSPIQDTAECHEQCLGGCYNSSDQGCVVCKSYTDHGTCVAKCPDDKYASSRFLRCYTREECLDKKQYIHKNICVDFCPRGYELNNETRECDPCDDAKNCVRVCSGRHPNDLIQISDIMHAEFLKGCEILNASILINIHEYIDEEELVENLKYLTEITGYLKINRSPYITSLNFFQNLKKIHGRRLEHDLYALIIYNNKNLSELWDVQQGFEIVNGGIYIYANDKLCNRHIRQFRENIKHDNSLDSFQTSDQEVLCLPAKLNLFLQVVNHRSIIFFWPKDQTLAEVEIIYRSLTDKEHLAEQTEIDTEVCNRIKWHRELKFLHELEENSTHYIHVVQNLQSHTRYACLVKTFDGNDNTQAARSEIKYATTQFDIPTRPNISLKGKTYDTLYIEFSNDESQVVDFYLLEVYDIPDDKELLDTRDYCDEPVMNFKDYGDEDYNDCCSRREKEREDQNFLLQLRQEFSCSLDQLSYCKPNYAEISDSGKHKAILRKRFEAWENSYTIRSLERFHLYVLYAQACNHAGCSSYSILSTRTNYSLAADKVYDFSACKVEDTNEYRIYFSEPHLPNGYITSYALHFRYHIFTENLTAEHYDLVCITRLEHEHKNYVYVGHFNHTFNQAAVRVHSLAHNTFMEWSNITTCQDTILTSTYKSWNIFLVSALIGAVGIVLCICYKKRCWRRILLIRQCLELNNGWRYLRPETFITEDRQILVDGFERVRFHNSPDEQYLEH